MDLSEMECIHNIFEHYVMTEITEHYQDKNLSSQDYADLACVALNYIPPKYVCNDVDAYFFMTTQEAEENTRRVKIAVAKAYQKISNPTDKAVAS